MSALDKLKERAAAKQEKKEQPQGGDDELIKGILVPVTGWYNDKPVNCHILLNPDAANKELLEFALDEVADQTGLKINQYNKSSGNKNWKRN